MARSRAGFTLVELLVVIVIISILATLAVSAFSQNDADKLNATARLIQSKIMLAKNKATADRSVHGIRFERDANDPRICRSASLIGSAGMHRETLSDIRYMSGDPSTTQDDYWQIFGNFNRLGVRNLLAVGTHVEIPADSGKWYFLTDVNFDPTDGELSIAGHYQNSMWGEDTTQPQAGEYIVTHPWSEDFGLTGNSIDCTIELAPTVLAGEPPLVFRQGTCIDFDASQVPDSWRDTANHCELLFNADGTATGSDSRLMHLYVTRLADVELTRNLFPDHPAIGGTRGLPIVPSNRPGVPAELPYVVTVFKTTGVVMTSEVDFTDGNADNQADTPFSFARKGKAQQ